MRRDGLSGRVRSGAAATRLLLGAIDRVVEPYSTMLALAELCRVPRASLQSLTLGDVQVEGDEARLTFTDEAGEEHEIPLRGAALARLAAYLQGWRSTVWSAPGYLFPQPRHTDEPASLAVAKRLLKRTMRGGEAAPSHEVD
jgi:hypothetical protein